MSSKKNKKIIGQRLRELAIAKFGSVSALARALGYKENSLTSYLQGRAAPGNKLLTALDELGLDTHYLLTGERFLNKEMLIELIENSGKSYSTIADLIGITTDELFNWLENLSERKSKRIEDAVKSALNTGTYIRDSDVNYSSTEAEQIKNLTNAMIKAFADIESLRKEINELKDRISSSGKEPGRE